MEILSKIKDLCRKNAISIAELERNLGFGNGSISKWNTARPSVDKVLLVAKHFDVSSDYLLDLTNIKHSYSHDSDDADIISIQRARENMSPEKKRRMMIILRQAFKEEFEYDKDGEDY